MIALSALFFPHYLGLAIGMHSIAQQPGDVIVGCVVIAGIALVRLLRPDAPLLVQPRRAASLDLVTQLLLVCSASPSSSRRARSRAASISGRSPSWHQITFALPLAFLAYTGLETVANLAEETRRAGTRPAAQPLLGIGAVVVVTVLIALVGLSAFPAPNGTTQLGTTWLRAPLMGIVYALGPHVAYWVERALRVYVGLTGALILLIAAATSNSGFGRLAYSLARARAAAAPLRPAQPPQPPLAGDGDRGRR